jgi:cell division protein FtsI/penicillin-binding protein 2
MRSVNINIIIFVIVAIIFVLKAIFNVKKKLSGNDFQGKIQRFFDNIANNTDNISIPQNSQRTVIYDEDGNEISSNQDYYSEDFENLRDQDVVIYDENGNMISLTPDSAEPVPKPPPVRPAEAAPPRTTNEVQKTAFVEEYEEEEPQLDAEMYRDFIRENGGASIIVKEILDKPLALR